jgi:hypothetical protein
MRKIPSVTEAQLASVTIPNHGKRYAPITYTQIIAEVKRQAAANGIDIVDSVYRTTEGGKIATGQYFLNYGNDPDIKLMFAWTNSYNKMRRFSCGMGTYVSVCLNGMLTADYSKYSRKHIGSAKKGNTAYVEMVNQIEEQFKLAANVFAKMVQDKNSMIDRSLTNTEINELLGRLFMDDVVGSVQMNIVKQQIKAPAYTYSGEKNSLWHFYNHVTHALKEEHPMSFDEAHYKLHEIITKNYLTSTVAAPVNVEAVVVPEADDNQLVEEFQPLDQEVDTILEQEEITTESVFVEDSVQEVQQENKTEEDDDLDWLNF